MWHCNTGNGVYSNIHIQYMLMLFNRRTAYRRSCVSIVCIHIGGLLCGRGGGGGGVDVCTHALHPAISTYPCFTCVIE